MSHPIVLKSLYLINAFLQETWSNSSLQFLIKFMGEVDYIAASLNPLEWMEKLRLRKEKYPAQCHPASLRQDQDLDYPNLVSL